MATEEGFPPPARCQNGSRLVFGGGGTPDLLSVLEVLGYVSIYGCMKYVGGASGAPRGRGRALGGWARPPPSWAPRGSPDRLFAYIYPYTLKTSGSRIYREFRRRKPL